MMSRSSRRARLRCSCALGSVNHRGWDAPWVAASVVLDGLLDRACGYMTALTSDAPINQVLEHNAQTSASGIDVRQIGPALT